MKPIIILTPDSMSAEDIKMLRDNELCVVVSKNPAAVKFVDPIPAMSSRTQIEQAAINLSRKVLHGRWGHITADTTIGINTFSRLFVECLIEGTPLDERGTRQEQEEQYFDQFKLDELRKLAREEAKAERAAAKAKK